MLPRKLQTFTFYLLLILLPSNLAKHFFFDFSSIYGVYVDYLIPTVYLTDLLLFILLALWAAETVVKIKSLCREHPPVRQARVHLWRKESIPTLSLLVFLLVAGLSVAVAKNQPAAVYKWLKLLEFTLLALWVAAHINWEHDFSRIVLALSLGVFYESLLTIFQWFRQESIFGFYFLGEPPYSILTPGIAKISFLGEVKVRPYGTLPHPNVLGGFLAVLLPWIIFYAARQVKEKARRYAAFGYQLLVIGVGNAALFLSFSRAAWATGGLGGIIVISYWLLATKDRNSRLRFLRVLPLFLAFCFFSAVTLAAPALLASLSWVRRLELSRMAVEMTRDYPLLGVGLNNFTVMMSKYGWVSGFPRFLQPVHNIYLLVAAETGLFGLAAFALLLATGYWLLVKRRTNNESRVTSNPLLLLSLSQIILLGMIDHYFLTIQQGSLLFFLILGLAFSLKKF